MKNKNLVLFVLLFLLGGELTSASAQGKSGIYKPWSHGRLKVSKENRYLMNADGTPFFWLGDTGWLLPEKLNRDEAAYYLEHCRQAGFNVVQVQTINGVPAMNFYGQYSMIDGFNFKNIDRKGVYGYWGRPFAIMVRFPDQLFDTTPPPMAFLNQSLLILASGVIILISIQIWKRRRM